VSAWVVTTCSLSSMLILLGWQAWLSVRQRDNRCFAGVDNGYKYESVSGVEWPLHCRNLRELLLTWFCIHSSCMSNGSQRDGISWCDSV
jgi:hypothetical protein